MTKPKQPKPPVKQILSTAIKERLIDVLKAGVSHPASLGLLIMTGSVVGQCLLKKSENDGSQVAKDINFQLGGLYAGAQGIATAAVVVPVITQAVQSAGTVAASLYAPIPPVKAAPP